MLHALTIRWTTPTVRHEVCVAPEQATAATRGEMHALLAQMLCHWLIDQMPMRAYEELIPTLIDIRDFHALPPTVEYPRLMAGKPLKRLSRSTRPEVELTED